MSHCQKCGHETAIDNATGLCLACRPDRMKRSLQGASDLITRRLGLEAVDKFSFKAFFSEVFSKHDPTEVERHLAVGTPDTTPPLHSTMAYMPNPWIFFRVLAGSAGAYLIFLFAWHEFNNLNLVPGLIMVGSFAIPCSVLILFFELNTPKNVSLLRVGHLVIVGGAISLLVSLFLFEAMPLLGIFGASAAGIVEEIGKLAALLIALRAVEHQRYRYKLNGLLLGAAVGTGFAAFESAGYALRIGLFDSQGMIDNIHLRGLLSPFSHIVWSAIAAAAFWSRRQAHPNAWATIKDPGFIKLFQVPVALHFIWNLPFQLPFMLKYIALGFVAWVVVISLVQSGLKEVENLYASEPNP